MEKKEINELLERYKQGACSAQEKARLESWYNTLAKDGSWSWSDSEKAEIAQSIRLKVDEQIAPQRSLPAFRPWMWAAAASVLLFLTIGIAMFRNMEKKQFSDRFYTETSVPAGSKIKFTLSDGSTVFLNGSSRIRYPKIFTASSREVTLLEGEAFFDIKHDEHKPFIVQTNSARIQVLGTAFNVKSYSTMEDTRVTVSRGRVAVKETSGSGSNQQVFLLPDEQVSVNKHSGSLQKSHIDSENIMGWTEGKLNFNNESLANIAATLHYTRNINISFSDPGIKSIRCTAPFTNKDNTEDIAFYLSKANNLSYTIKNNEIILKRK